MDLSSVLLGQCFAMSCIETAFMCVLLGTDEDKADELFLKIRHRRDCAGYHSHVGCGIFCCLLSITLYLVHTGLSTHKDRVP